MRRTVADRAGTVAMPIELPTGIQGSSEGTVCNLLFISP